MMRGFFLLFFCCISLTAAPEPVSAPSSVPLSAQNVVSSPSTQPVVRVLPDGRSFEDGGKVVDSFISRTYDRIFLAWAMCWEEFRLAGKAAMEESREVVKQEAENQVDKVIEKISESAKEAVRENLP